MAPILTCCSISPPQLYRLFSPSYLAHLPQIATAIYLHLYSISLWCVEWRSELPRDDGGLHRQCQDRRFGGHGLSKLNRSRLSLRPCHSPLVLSDLCMYLSWIVGIFATVWLPLPRAIRANFTFLTTMGFRVYSVFFSSRFTPLLPAPLPPHTHHPANPPRLTIRTQSVASYPRNLGG